MMKGHKTLMLKIWRFPNHPKVSSRMTSPAKITRIKTIVKNFCTYCTDGKYLYSPFTKVSGRKQNAFRVN